MMSNQDRIDYSRNDPILVALGGNALQGGHHFRHFPALAAACKTLVESSPRPMIITHGNGPQIGQLALDTRQNSYPGLDVLGAEIEGLLGYLIEQELSNFSDSEKIISILTRVEVSADDPMLAKPTKLIGPWLREDQAKRLSRAFNWTFKHRNGKYKRIVASPKPQRILQVDAIRELLGSGYIVICAGGGGIPVVRDATGFMQGVDAVIDKDLSSSLLAQQLNARTLIFVTDVEGVYRDWNTNNQRLLSRASPTELEDMALEAGSMGPKAQAACHFVHATGNNARIGALKDLGNLLKGQSGTLIQYP